MVVEYAVVIRRQFPQEDLRWQLFLGSGKVKEDPNFLAVMNFAGAMGFEAVSAGHFDTIGVPEVLLQRRMELPPAVPLAVPADRPGKAAAQPAPKAAPRKKVATAAKS